MRAHLRHTSHESSSDFAPVTTIILPEVKMSAVVFRLQICMMTAAGDDFEVEAEVGIEKQESSA